MYEAYVTRASDQGPNAHTYDNSQVMENILALRHEAAQLLGFKNYAERSLAKKMADSPEHVINFLSELADKSHKVAQQDYNELVEYAKQHHGQSDLNAWDLTYYSEKLREHKYDINQETLKPYFPETRVVPGMFEVVKRLYDIHIEEVDAVDTWHKDVRFYEIKDHDGNLRGQFYLDLYAREKKRGGAWMDDCQGRNTLANGETQIPVAYLTCNLSQPIGDKPALFTHDEVTTLFHEFGHGLHHMLTQVDHIGVSGINGVAWDAVELPSQFMENWCWEREALDLITGHFETGETLPQALFDKMLAAKNFQAGMQMVRQLEFALFDFKLHADYDPELGARVQETLDDVRKQVAVIKAPSFNRFQHSFTHIFAGGYAAGYYSYKWAEVLSADAFSKFEEHGIFDQKTGAEFLSSILEKGGSQEPMELFVAFRGREPSIDPLLRHSGIAA
jgi:oligopeptidase A